MLSRLQPRLVGHSRDGRDDILPTPLPRTDSTNIDMKTREEFPRLLRVSGPSSGPQLQGLQHRQVRAQAGPGRLVSRHTTAAWAAGATEDVMTTYLPIVLGQDALQWL
jgi:hypothetical protein